MPTNITRRQLPADLVDWAIESYLRGRAPTEIAAVLERTVGIRYHPNSISHWCNGVGVKFGGDRRKPPPADYKAGGVAAEESSTAQFYRITGMMAKRMGREPPQTWPEVEREIRATLLPPEAERELLIQTNDHQGLYVDTEAARTRATIIADLQPDALVWAGDIFDNFAVSRHTKDPEAMHEQNLGDEVKLVNAYLDQDMKLAPNARRVWLDGNHEAFLDSFLDQNAPQLKYLGKDLTIPGLVRADERHMTYRRYKGPNSKPFDFHGLRIQHSGFARQALGANTRAAWTKWPGTSGSMGHSHRAEVLYVQVERTLYQWYSAGCLCLTEGMDYVSGDAGWTQAVLMAVHAFGKVHCQLGVMQDHKVILGGKLYGPDGVFRL